MRLSIIVPVYNEIDTIEIIINKILNLKLRDKEIVIVDDFSEDGTREVLSNFKKNKDLNIIFHDKNMGKGACIKSATKIIKGDYVVIQDADLEYDPEELLKFVDFAEKKKQR